MRELQDSKELAPIVVTFSGKTILDRDLQSLNIGAIIKVQPNMKLLSHFKTTNVHHSPRIGCQW